MNLYVIGPVTGKPGENRQEFERVADALFAAGHIPMIPHIADDMRDCEDWQSAMCASIREMLRFDFNPYKTKRLPRRLWYEGVAMLDGWEHSRGARIEHGLAEALAIPCRPWREWLRAESPSAPLAATGASQPVLARAC